MKLSDRDLFNQFADILKGKPSPAVAPDIFAGSDTQTLAGLAVYRNNIRSSLSRVLAEKYPVIQQLVGEDFFKFLAHEYYHTYPPTSPLVTRYGDALPVFLEGFEPVTAYPYLPDMARLEQYWLEAYHAPDATPMTPQDIIAAAGDDIAYLTFEFHPSVRLLASAYPVGSIWQTHQPDAKSIDISGAGPENILIARPYNDVSNRVLTHAVFSALEALLTGHTLEDAVEQAANIDAAFDPQSFFQDLFQFEIITRCAHGRK